MSFLDSINYQTEVDEDDLDTAVENFCKERAPFGCREQPSELMLHIMEENNLSLPKTVEDALQLYITLLAELQSVFYFWF